jgi:aqualysin 1
MNKSRPLLALLAASTFACQEPVSTARESGVSLVVNTAIAAGPDSDSYIVVFRSGVADIDARATEIAAANGGRLSFIYRTALRGFAGHFSAVGAAAIMRQPDVLRVERDGEVHVVTTETNAPWGLDRVDQRALPLSTTYSYTATGSGVNAYIIDTGIRTTHVEFGGRATGDYTAINDGNGTNDCNGHGTHVSGTVGGTTYGIAKQVRLHAVRVLGCTGSGATSGVIAGVDWVTANHISPAVANMSLGGGASSSLDDAVRNSIASGVTYAIAAGNSSADACLSSPSRVTEALVVGATSSNDAMASFSNFGTCLDVFAPGVSILSAYNGSDTQTATLSGTSMATPHVTGTAALYLEVNPNATPGTVATALASNATPGVVGSIGAGSPNLLLYTGFIGGGTPNQAPVAKFTVSCLVFVCTLDGRSSTDDVAVVTYVWALGKSSNGITPDSATGSVVSNVDYFQAGSRTVTLKVTDGGGLSNSVTQTFTVGGSTPPPNQPPVASFTASCTGLTCTFDSSTSSDDVGITARAWTFGDGATATGNQVTLSHTYAAGGSFTVALTVTDGGGLTNSESQTVSVTAPPTNQAPVAKFTVSCVEFICTLDGRSSTDDVGVVSYIWALGKSSNGATPDSATGSVVSNIDYYQAGSRTVTLKVIDGGGLSNSVTQTFTVGGAPPPNQPPVADFTIACNTSHVCTLDGRSSTDDVGVVSYSWALGKSSNGVTQDTATGAVVSNVDYYQNAPRTVTLTVTDAGGLTSSITKTFSVP